MITHHKKALPLTPSSCKNKNQHDGGWKMTLHELREKQRLCFFSRVQTGGKKLEKIVIGFLTNYIIHESGVLMNIFLTDNTNAPSDVRRWHSNDQLELRFSEEGVRYAGREGGAMKQLSRVIINFVFKRNLCCVIFKLFAKGNRSTWAIIYRLHSIILVAPQ